MNVYLASPRGFCAGVDRAIDIVERALDIFGAPIYVRHEVVHNRFVVDDLAAKGAVFVEQLAEIPDAATVIFSAHGVSQQVRQEAAQRNLRVFDATCPLVTKVHLEVARHARDGVDVILIGHAGHPEVEGTLGQYDSDNSGHIILVETLDDVTELEVREPKRLAYVTQTTLSVDDTREIVAALKHKFPDIKGPRKDDICYATQNRQDAVRGLSARVDVMLVIGSTNSSNSNRLRELAAKQNIAAYLIDGVEDINENWLRDIENVGVTAGASAPELLVRDVLNYLKQKYNAVLHQEDRSRIESVHFQLPRELRA